MMSSPEGGLPRTPDTLEKRSREWFVIHTYSGYENKVKANLEKRVASMSMEDWIFQVLVPTEEEMEVKDGKKKLVRHKVFPGYVLVEMVLTDESWYVVRNTPGVTGFVGSGSRPIPLQDWEIEQILGRAEEVAEQAEEEIPVRHRIDLSVGQPVRVTVGPFAGFVGNVENIDETHAKVRVLVSMFGRETPVELDFDQLEEV